MSIQDRDTIDTEKEQPALLREWQAFWLALGFLSRIPMLARIDYSQRLMNQSSLYFPLVGLLLGALYAATFTVLALLWPSHVALLLVLCGHLWLTGAFHEDGLADSADALGGGMSVAQRLTIMKDSRIGTYGAVALIGALSLKFALLGSLEAIWLGLLLAPCIARLAPLLLMWWLPYVTDPTLSKSKPVAEGFSGTRLLLAIGLVAMVAGVSQTMVWALVAVTIVVVFWGFTLKRLLGGYTGDTLGASVILAEIAFLLLLLI